mmetsp:Transcript_1991/g.5020  ORF Transcript_1991/g.5020 Transcript_1991/m.5020 type:complete len:113 (+) Transcript_1991:184-522(+)
MFDSDGSGEMCPREVGDLLRTMYSHMPRWRVGEVQMQLPEKVTLDQFESVIEKLSAEVLTEDLQPQTTLFPQSPLQPHTTFRRLLPTMQIARGGKEIAEEAAAAAAEEVAAV